MPGTVSFVTCAEASVAVTPSTATNDVITRNRIFPPNPRTLEPQNPRTCLADRSNRIAPLLRTIHGDDAGRHHVGVGDLVFDELFVDVVHFATGVTRSLRRDAAGR